MLLTSALASLNVARAQLPAQPSIDRDKAAVAGFFDQSAYSPGETARLAVVVTVDDGWHVQANKPTFEYLIPTQLEVTAPDPLVPQGFVYPPPELFRADFETEPLAVYAHQFSIFVRLPIPEGTASQVFPIDYSLTYQACDDRSCLAPRTARGRADLVVGGDGVAQHASVFENSNPANAVSRSTAQRAAGGSGLLSNLWILPIALLGGLILNAMPCVLPVLSLKIFGLVKNAGKGRGTVVAGALATSAGILASFWLLAGVAIAARASGRAVGWGIQFQSPAFVTLLLSIVLLFSLNLWGLFEIPTPAFLAHVGSNSASRGLSGHFLTGLFATLMATPCSAPFLGTAVGFALAKSGATTIVVFTALGLGMASPYLALAAWPSAGRLLPRPGAWMETVRGTMGFLLFGALIWLFFVLQAQLSAPRLAAVQGVLLVAALVAWLNRRHARMAAALAMITIVGIAVLIAGSAPPLQAEPRAAASRIPWLPFEEKLALELASGGDLVFVDVTADWCATCKVNERLVLESDEVVAAFAERGIVAMRADWTNPDPVIAAYLESFARYAIPFYVIYRPNQPPHVFGEVLTRGGVLRVIAESSSRLG